MDLASGHRKLSEYQFEEMKKSLEKTTAAVSESYFQGQSYDDLLAKKLKDSYETPNTKENNLVSFAYEGAHAIGGLDVPVSQRHTFHNVRDF